MLSQARWRICKIMLRAARLDLGVIAEHGGVTGVRVFLSACVMGFLGLCMATAAFPQEARWKTLVDRFEELYQQGRDDEALKVGQEALKIAEDTFGPAHPTVAHSLERLARLYGAQGKYLAAESLYQRALTIREVAFGSEHPEVARSLDALAGLHQSQGNYAAAEPLYRRALAIMETALGGDRPEVAMILSNVAELYQVEGKYAAAETLGLGREISPSTHIEVSWQRWRSRRSNWRRTSQAVAKFTPPPCAAAWWTLSAWRTPSKRTVSWWNMSSSA